MTICKYIYTIYSHYGVYGPLFKYKYRPEKQSTIIFRTGNQEDIHDPDQTEQTADIARNENLSHYPQVKSKPDIHPVKDRSNRRIHPVRDAVHIFIFVWHFCGCDITPPCRDVIPPVFFLKKMFQSVITNTPASRAPHEPVQYRWRLLHNAGAI